MTRKKSRMEVCGVITREQQIKAMKARSSDYQMPKSGYFMTAKDRPRNRNWRRWVEK